MKAYIKIFIIAAVLLFSFAAYAESGCSYFDKYGDHDWIYGKTEPTCDSAGEAYRDCSECGMHDVQETIAAKGHDWKELELVKEAACESDGEKIVACTVCGQQKSLILPATGHVYGEWEIITEATCTHNGEQKTSCIACGAEIKESIERAEHEYGDWHISVEATDHSMGKRYRKCAECGATNEDMYYPEGTLYRGMQKSDEVKQMQLALMQLGLLKDKADGIFGKNTEAAVIAFQESAGLEVTGIAYPQTLDALYMAIENKTAEDIEAADIECCIHGSLLSSEGATVYCQHHTGLIAETVAIYDAAADKAAALSEIISIWEEELERLYGEWEAAADDEQKNHIIESQTTFYDYLQAQIDMLNELFGSESDVAAEYTVNIMIEQCAYLCEFMHTAE